MLLDSGTLEIRRGENTASPGSMPKYEYKKIWAGYYGEKTVGLQRMQFAMQNDAQADLLVQIQRTYSLKPEDRVELFPYAYQPEEGANLYKVTQIQQVTDDDGLPKADLTLQRLEGLDAAGQNRDSADTGTR